MNPSGESPGYDAKRRLQCATPSCKTPVFSACCNAPTRHWRVKRTHAVAPAAVCCTAPTTRGSRAPVRAKHARTSSRASASAATDVVGAPPRCRCAFWVGASIRRAEHSRAHPGTLAPVVASAVSADSVVAGPRRALHAAGGHRLASRQPARTLRRRGRGIAAPAPVLPESDHGQAGRVERGPPISRRGCG